jgi:hypothetical protein
MSEQQTRIEWTGNIQVHHPVKEPATIREWQPLADAQFKDWEDWYASRNVA